MNKQKIRDTLFIDMKYIVLYRKLGYREIKPDVFEYTYNDGTKIIIEAESQKFKYNNTYYELKNYKDFVRLECIDRLLKKGYASTNIFLKSKNYDITLKKNGEDYLNILIAQWGKDYDSMLDQYSGETINTTCLYTSQLSGGLVTYISKIYTMDTIYDRGVFEKYLKPYQDDYSKKQTKHSYNKDFIVEDNILIKYEGTESSVLIPEGITKIEVGSFGNCQFLEEVFIPDSVTSIGGDAFIYCANLKKVNISKNIDEIGDNPFAGCLDIKIINESPYFVLEDMVLFDKAKRVLIHYTASNINKQYNIPKTVEWLGKHSFYKCKFLELVIISENINYMGNNPFSDCENIVLENNSPHFEYIEGVLYNKDKTMCIHYSMGSEIKVVNLQKNVRTIGRNCFWNCSKIEKIIIPISVRQIGYNPFAGCSNVTIENNSASYKIVDGILYDSTLQELLYCSPKVIVDGTITIVDTVKNIGRSAFTACTTLKEINIPNNVQSISRGAFSFCVNLEIITIPKSVQEIGDRCFSKCHSLKKISIPINTKIGNHVFEDCNTKIERF